MVLSLGLGLAVLAAVGQIDGTLRGSIAREMPEVAPSFFFVDLQPDQIDGFKAMMAETVSGGTATQLQDIAGMLGKTGTAETGSDTGGQVTWFVGFAGTDVSKPTIALAVPWLTELERLFNL